MLKSSDHEFYQDTPRPVRAMAKSYTSGYEGGIQSHARAEFLFAESGIMRVTTSHGMWIVPPHLAVWLPPDCPHRGEAVSAVELRTLYIRPDFCPVSAPARPCLIRVSSLLRELLCRATNLPIEYDEQGRDGRTIALLMEEIDWTPVQTPTLPRLAHPRLISIERALFSDPGDTRTLGDWANSIGTSQRTLARLFRRDTGMSFGHWREQFRVLAVLPRLIEGEQITSVSIDLGYETPGAFTAMFRRVLGVTPTQYLADR